MNKTMKNIIFLSFLVTSINAGTYTNKTYIQTRPFLSNLPMEYAGWHTQVNKKDIGSWGGSFQATGFYQGSTEEEELGKYFGYLEQEGNQLIRDYIEVNTGLNDLSSRSLIHNYDNNNNLLATGKFSLRPSQRTLGLRLDYYQNISNFFFKISTPITHVTSGINPEVIGNLTSIQNGANTSNEGLTIMDYFAGRFEETQVAANLQERLQYGKIEGNHNRTGLGDIEVALGYNFYKKKGHHIKFGADLTIPTSNDADSEWLFEPITGNGGYWALGTFLDTKFVFWKKNKANVEFLATANLQYLFESSEQRIVGIKNYSGVNIISIPHYQLFGEQGRNALFPGANVLTRNVDVEPGIHFEGLAGIAFNSDRLTLDAGYNIFYKESENVHLQEEWVDNKYALAGLNFNSNNQFDVNNTNHAPVGSIQSENIDLDAAQNPSAVTHKIYGAVNYCFNDLSTPLMFNLGGSYEFHSGNTALEGFEFWLKSAISF